MPSSSSDSRRPFTIVSIVEGHGEVKAVPILIQNWLRFRRFNRYFQVDVKGLVRTSGKGDLTASYHPADELGVEYFTSLASLRRPDAILILLDADDDCPATLGATLLGRARSVVSPWLPLGVVVANRAYEAWFLAAFASANFRRKLAEEGLPLALKSIPRGFEVERSSGCKGRIAEWIGVDVYRPIVHQEMLTRHLPFERKVVARRSRSFRKLLQQLESLTAAARKARRGR